MQLLEEMEKLCLLGLQHTEWGAVTRRSTGNVSACISVGSDPNSDSLLFKGDKSYPNEDCLVALRSGAQWLLAVADGHAGHHTSHAIIDGLHQMEGIPSELTAWLSGFRFPPQIRGGTTLVVALFNEESRRVVGLSFGDSSIVSVGADGYERHNVGNRTFLRPPHPPPLERANFFEFSLLPGRSLLLFSDGIDECSYRCPEQSITPEIIQRLTVRYPNAQELTWELTQLALAGVDGHAGGQDNIALVGWSG